MSHHRVKRAIRSSSFSLILERLATIHQLSAVLKPRAAPNDKREMPYPWHSGKECAAFSCNTPKSPRPPNKQRQHTRHMVSR